MSMETSFSEATASSGKGFTRLSHTPRSVKLVKAFRRRAAHKLLHPPPLTHFHLTSPSTSPPHHDQYLITL